MRAAIAALASALLVSGCSTFSSAVLPEATPTPTETASPGPETWLMGPDSFGPITTDTTKDEALETGYFKEAPGTCSARRVDWKGQKYTTETTPGTVGISGPTVSKPHLASITFDAAGKVKFIDPGPDTATDQGIRRSDALARLEYTYGDDLIAGASHGPSRGTYAVRGDNGTLVFLVLYRRVVGFFVTTQTVETPTDVAALVDSDLEDAGLLRVSRNDTC